jgi:CO/xanthine dehydrogenase Mo-binding subunit
MSSDPAPGGSHPAQDDRNDESGADQSFEQVGHSLPRTDAPGKVTGEAAYTMDMYPEDVLHAKLVTSEEAHARLREVETAAAEELDGVVAVATADDAPATRLGQFVRDEPILAEDTVRYVGEPIAVVAAESEATARAAVDRVTVEYDPLEPVTDLEAAADRDPPAVVHEDLRTYETGPEGDHLDGAEGDHPNLLTIGTEETGDLDAAFERADLVFEDEYTVNPLQHCTLEPHVAVAAVEAGTATLWTSHQMPHVIRRELARLFPAFDAESVVVRTPFAGGAFGGKENPVVEPRVLTVARMVDRPVRLALSREQEFTTSPGRPEFRIRLKDGVLADGTLVARDMTMDINVGGYDLEGFNIATSIPGGMLGSYDVPAVRQRCRAIYTNRPPYGAFRGFGLPEANFAAERHMNRVAAELGLDPLEYRAQNLLEAGDQNPVGDRLRPCQTEAVLRSPVERIRETDVATAFPGYAGEEWALGVGFAYGSKAVPQGVTEVRLDVDPSGGPTARVGAPDVGQGSNTVVAQMVAEALDTTPDRVSVVAGDTDATEPDFQGPSGSRFTPYTGNAILLAAEKLRSELTSLAATIRDVDDPDALRFEDGHVVAPDGDPLLSMADLADSPAARESPQFEDGVFTAHARYEFDEQAHIYWVPVAQAVVVACNRLTGETDVLQVVTAADVGQAINPTAVEQQLEGGTGQAIGSALYEEIGYDDGHVTNGSLKDYAVPKATELPHDSETIVFESVDTEGPFGAKSVGEIALFPTPPAIASAIEDAVGIECTDLPMTPDRVLAKLQRLPDRDGNSTGQPTDPGDDE